MRATAGANTGRFTRGRLPRSGVSTPVAWVKAVADNPPVTLLEIQDIHAGYGKMEILRGVSLRVEAGQVVSIIGPNGAGKSTVFKTLFGLLPVRQGQVRFAGEDVTNQAPAELLRRGMTYVPQGRNVFPLMTVEQNLRLGAYIRPRSAALEGEIERVYEIFPMLREARGKRAAALSGRSEE